MRTAIEAGEPGRRAREAIEGASTSLGGKLEREACWWSGSSIVRLDGAPGRVRPGNKEAAVVAALGEWSGVEVEGEVGATRTARIGAIPTSPRPRLGGGTVGVVWGAVTGDAPMWGLGLREPEACRAWLAGFITAGGRGGPAGTGSKPVNSYWR